MLAGLPPEIAPAIQTALQAFSDEKRGRTFLVRYGHWVDVSHECLLRQWQLCKSWMQTEERDKKQLEDLAEAAARTGWRADMTTQEKKSRMALAGFTLDALVKWRDEAKPDAAWARRYVPESRFANALAYLEWSEAVQQRERSKAIRRAYKVAVAAGAAFVIVGILALIAVRYAVEARES